MYQTPGGHVPCTHISIIPVEWSVDIGMRLSCSVLSGWLRSIQVLVTSLLASLRYCQLCWKEFALWALFLVNCCLQTSGAGILPGSPLDLTYGGHRSQFNMFSKLHSTCVAKIKKKQINLTVKTLYARREMSRPSEFVWKLNWEDLYLHLQRVVERRY